MTDEFRGANGWCLIEAEHPIWALMDTGGSGVYTAIRAYQGQIQFGIVTVTTGVPSWLSTYCDLRKEIIMQWLPADAAAGDTWERTIFRAGGENASSQDEKYTVVFASLIPDGDIGQATNYMTLQIQNKGTDGNGTTAVATKVVDDSGTLTDFNETSMGTILSASITEGQVLSLKKTVTLTGQIWPGGMVVLELQRVGV